MRLKVDSSPIKTLEETLAQFENKIIILWETEAEVPTKLYLDSWFIEMER